MQLDKYKIDVISKFFENDQYAGWENIAINLIHNGVCIVPGNDCIYKGGIGNFISVNYHPVGAVDCVEYNFDVNDFITSKIFQENLLGHINSTKSEIQKLESKLKETQNKLKSIESLKC